MNKFNQVYNDIIVEHSISKIYDYIKNFECAAISASRSKLTNVTKNTLLPENYVDEMPVTKDENRQRNTMLKSKLLKLGYGVTSLDGKYAEAGETFPGKETSYFVVNLKNDPEFKNNIFKLSEMFNQDSFLYKPINSISAELIGTNNAERNEEWGTPGYNQVIAVGEFHPEGFDGALSKMGNKMFQFRLNENKNQALSFIGENVLSDEIFDKLSINNKAYCSKTANAVDISEVNMFPFEDYSSSIRSVSNSKNSNKLFEYVNCMNKCLISEDSLNRTLNVIKDKDFAILTAYRSNFSKAENIKRNRELRSKLNEKKIGVHQLVGHWQECPSGKNYTDCKSSELIDVVERSYLVAKPNEMSFDEFKNLILSLLNIQGETQDAAVIKNSEGIYLLFNNGELDKIGDDVTLGKINQAYSQHVKNNTPFVFEGIEIPASNYSKQMYTKHYILF